MIPQSVRDRFLADRGGDLPQENLPAHLPRVAAGYDDPVRVPEAPAPLTVTVPPTAKGGDTIAVQMPDGQSMNVVVPPGLNPGDPFQVQAPAPVVAAVATVVG